jgi:hypothetical protein
MVAGIRLEYVAAFVGIRTWSAETLSGQQAVALLMLRRQGTPSVPGGLPHVRFHPFSLDSEGPRMVSIGSRRRLLINPRHRPSLK